MLFLAFVGFSCLFCLFGHFTTIDNTKNDVEIPVINSRIVLPY
jgi:hypothetical protein